MPAPSGARKSAWGGSPELPEGRPRHLSLLSLDNLPKRAAKAVPSDHLTIGDSHRLLGSLIGGYMIRGQAKRTKRGDTPSSLPARALINSRHALA